MNEMKARQEAMRERLRAKCEKIVAAVEVLPEPKTFLEAERAARVVILADKMIERVYSEPKAAKEGARFGTDRTQTSEIRANKAASGSTRLACDPPPPASQGRIKNAAPIVCTKSEDEADETPLSKTYLKLEQLAAKITALDAEFNNPKPTNRGS